MTEVQAAQGRRALDRLPSWSARTARARGGCWTRAWPTCRACRCAAAGSTRTNKHSAERLAPGWDRDAVMTAIAAEGVPCLQGACAEIYREKAFAVVGAAPVAAAWPTSSVRRR